MALGLFPTAKQVVDAGLSEDPEDLKQVVDYFSRRIAKGLPVREVVSPEMAATGKYGGFGFDHAGRAKIQMVDHPGPMRVTTAAHEAGHFRDFLRKRGIHGSSELAFQQILDRLPLAEARAEMAGLKGMERAGVLDELDRRGLLEARKLGMYKKMPAPYQHLPKIWKRFGLLGILFGLGLGPLMAGITREQERELPY